MATAFDDLANFADTTVVTAPSPALSGTTALLAAGNGPMPTPPFYAVTHPSGGAASFTDAEIVRVTAMSGQQITAMDRAQQGTSAKAIDAGWRFAAVLTETQLEAIQTAVNTAEDDIDALESGKSAVGHTHAATDLASGTVAPARLGSGTPSGTTFLRGDSVWATPPGGGAAESPAYLPLSDYGTPGFANDNTSNIVTWMADALAQGKIALGTPGEWRTTAPIEPPHGLVIEGITAGGYETEVGDTYQFRLVGDTSLNGPVVRIPAGNKHIHLRGVHIDGSQATVGGHGVEVVAAGGGEEAQVHIEDCYINSAKGDGIRIGANRRAVKVRDTTVLSCTGQGVYVGSSDCTVMQCIIGGNGGDGIEIADSVAKIVNNEVYGNLSGIVVNANVPGFLIQGNGVDRNERHGIYVSSGASGSITAGNVLHQNSQESVAGFNHITLASGVGEVVIDGNAFQDDGVSADCNWGVELQGGSGDLAQVYLGDNPAQSAACYVSGKYSHTPTAGSGVNADTLYTVAASNTPTALKDNADYVCDGTADHVEIQAALDALPANGGEVWLLPGTFDSTDIVKILVEQTSLRFMPGARLRRTGVTGRTPLIQVLKSNSFVYHPYCIGSGAKGNGIGVQIGGQASTEPIVGGDQPGGVHIFYPRFDNLDTGLEFGVQSDGSQSVGDCVLWGGRITDCKRGISSDGFVNYVYGPFISTCDIGIIQTTARYSGRIVVTNATINQWADAAIVLQRGRASTFTGLWMEHTATQSGVPTEVIRINPSGSDEVINPTFNGVIHIHPIDIADGTPELYGLRLSGRVDGLSVEHLEFTDELPSTGLVRCDATFAGGSNVIKKVSFGNDIPAAYTHSLLLSRDSGATGELAILEVPGPGGSVAGTTIGGTTPLPSRGTYRVGVSGTPNSAIYWAKRHDGHIAAVAQDTGTTSGLKAVLEGLAADDVHFEFGPHRYHFLDAPLGNEAWAGDQDHAAFGASATPTTGLVFSGAGKRATVISNRTNWAGAADTEPFSFTNCQEVTIEDLAVESCGFYKSTTDAIDFDQGARCTVRNVMVRRSRSRGIVCDGGDAGKNATGNLITGCIVQGRPSRPGLALVSGGSLSSGTTYRYAVSWVLQDLAGIGSAEETKPSEVASVTATGSTLSVRVNIPIGPYDCTARKIYRAPAGSASWVLVATVSDNTTKTYLDTGGAGTGVSMPVSHRSAIPQAGIELLGASGNEVVDNVLDGCGDGVNGANGCGINLVRKGSGSSTVNSDRNIVRGNIVRQSVSSGIRIYGGSDNLVQGNTIINPGTVASRQQHLRIDGTTGAVTNNNQLKDNRCIEDQDANSWTTGKTSNNIITITSGGTPTDNIVEGNVLDVGATATTISNSGTTTRIRRNKGFNPQGVVAISVGASPFTYTAGPTPEVVYITSGTVSAIAKNGITVFTQTGRAVTLEPGEQVTVTYSSTPVMNADRK